MAPAPLYGISMAQLLMVALFFPFCILTIWLVWNRRRLGALWRLRFQRSRIVKVKMVTPSGMEEEHYLIPDNRGIITLRGGSYVFNRDLALINSRYRIPTISFIESQPQAVVPEILAHMVKVKAQVTAEDGTVSEQDIAVPSVVANYKQVAKKLDTWTAEAIKKAFDSRIIEDIITATMTEMGQIKMILFATLAGLAVTVLVGLILWHQVGNLQSTLDAIINSSKAAAAAAAAAATHASPQASGGP